LYIDLAGGVDVGTPEMVEDWAFMSTCIAANNRKVIKKGRKPGLLKAAPLKSENDFFMRLSFGLRNYLFN
jgi:hypothetical protein